MKIQTLLRHASPGGDWIETGTYLAETSKVLAISFDANQIYTIEPSEALFKYVSRNLRRAKNINFIHGTSEEYLQQTISIVKTDNLNFWLDGHHSGDVTFLGPKASPIIEELEIIEKNLIRFTKCTIFIDDFRLFGLEKGYPKKEVLVGWAINLEMEWTVENDILIMKKG